MKYIIYIKYVKNSELVVNKVEQNMFLGPMYFGKPGLPETHPTRAKNI